MVDETPTTGDNPKSDNKKGGKAKKANATAKSPRKTETMPNPQYMGEGKRYTWHLPALIVSLLAVIGLVVALMVVINRDSDSADQGEPARTTPPVNTSSSECVNGFPLAYDPGATHVGNVIEPDENGIAVRDADDLLQAAKTNPMTLAFYVNVWMPSIYPNANDWRQFIGESGKCMNQKGVEAYYALKGAVGADIMTIEQVDPSWYNSGQGPDGAVVNSNPGISGNLTALVFTDPVTGRQIKILVRCGNPAFKSHPPNVQTQPLPPDRPHTPVRPKPKPPVTPPTKEPNCENGGIPADDPRCVQPPTDCPDGTFYSPSYDKCLADKTPTTAPHRPDGITPQPLPSTDPLEPTRPEPPANQQTTPIPTQAPPVSQTTRPSVPPVLPDLPAPAQHKPTQAPVVTQPATPTNHAPAPTQAPEQARPQQPTQSGTNSQTTQAPQTSSAPRPSSASPVSELPPAHDQMPSDPGALP